MKEEKWKRRTLKGATLKVATLPWSVIVKQDDKGSKIGFVPELLLGIQVEANFSIEWVEPEDRKYGALVEVNGSTRWNGLVGMAHRHEVDLVAAGLSITRQGRINCFFKKIPTLQMHVEEYFYCFQFMLVKFEKTLFLPAAVGQQVY